MSSIPHFRTAHTNDSSDDTAPEYPQDRGSRISRRTRYREWADYGAPPLLPLRPPTAAEVRQALLQRRMSPTQTNVLQHLLKLAGARSWCYFSTIGWMNALSIARTQLLRARRELVEQHILYYQEFPPEPAAPYLDQPNNGWIGFYPPSEWLPRTRHWGGARQGAGRPKKQQSCDSLNSESQSQANGNRLIFADRQQGDCDSLISQPGESQATPVLSKAHHIQAACNSLNVSASEQNQLDTASLLERNQLDTVCLPQSASPPEANAPLLDREGSKKRRPVSHDTGAAPASPLARNQAKVQETDEHAVTEQSAFNPPEPGGQQTTPAEEEELAPPTAEFNIASERNKTQEEDISPEQLAAWHEEIEEARAAEEDAWRALRAAETALAEAGHGWGSGRDGLLVQRQEASRVHWQAQRRREAYELLVSLIEQGAPKREAIERTLDAYPHLRREPEEASALDEEAPGETPAEPEEPVLEAWTILTEEHWRRALFGQFCRLWQWPTGKELNGTARGRLNVAVKAMHQVRLRPEYVPLFVAWWKQCYPWREHALPWELAASVNDFFQWQEANEARNPA